MRVLLTDSVRQLPPLPVWTGISLPFAADLIIMLIPIIFTVKMWKKYGGGA